jgi:site-specific DNA recombinase
MEQAILLCRISDIKQSDGYSLEAQEKHGKEYCSKNKLKIIKLFSFVETASKSNKREKFNEVLEFITSKVLKDTKTLHLIVEKSDRLTRNFSSKEKIQLLVMSGKLIVHYYKDKRVFTKDCSPAEIFNDDIQTAVSKYHSLNLSRESRKGMVEKASQGWFPSRAPYGYINFSPTSSNSDKGRSIIIPDPNITMVRMVQRIYELRATQGMSFSNILKIVRDEALIPPGKTLAKSGIEGILANKFYGGTFIWQEKEYKGNHELIIPHEHFKAVHSRGKRDYSYKPTGLLSGFLKCSNPECDCYVVYDPKIKKLRQTGEERTYHYYHCSDGKGVHKSIGEKQKNISEDKLLEKFQEPIRDISITKEIANAISKALKKAHEKTIQAHRRNIERYKTAVKQTEAEEDKAYELLSSGAVDKLMFDRQIKK